VSAKPKGRWASGLTIIEMVSTIVVLSIIILGLATALRFISFHYQDDTVRLEIRNYGNIIMREIMKEISLSRFIDKDEINSFTRLKVTRYNRFGTPKTTIVSADPQDGILINGDYPLGGNLTLPVKGRFRNRKQRRVTLVDFEAQEVPMTRGNLRRVSQATWELDLILRMETAGAVGNDQVEDIEFHRTIFMPNKFIKG